METPKTSIRATTPESKKNAQPAASSQTNSLSLNDVYFILFRRKWIILLFSLLGVAAAAVLYFIKKPAYRSNAKLLVRYVVENKALMPGDNSQVRQPDAEGSTIISSEIEILTSFDLYMQVAEAVGPEKILRLMGGGDDKFVAAVLIAKNVTPEVPPRSNIIKVTFRHPDKEVIKPVLDKLIEEYLKRHAAIHQGLGSFDNVLSQQSDQLRFRLNETEEELRKLKSKNGVISVDETRNSYVQEMSNLRREMFNTKAALAEARATLASTPTNIVSLTNAATTAGTEIVDPEIPRDTFNDYRETVTRLVELRNKAFTLQSQYSDENALVKRMREQIAEVDQQRKNLEQRYPGLVRVRGSSTSMTVENPALALERGRVAGLEAKVKFLETQLETVHADAARLDEIETPLKQLQRKRDLEETNYRYFSAGVERSRVDETLGATRLSNISVVQSPTAPTRDDLKRLKLIGAALGGGVFGGLGLAFLLEMFLDQTIRRAHEVEGRLRIPLFMAIPYVNGKAMKRLSSKKRKRLASNGTPKEDPPAGPPMSWEADHPLRPMFEALRDRALLHFKNINHKPKLVAISTCSKEAGATTVSAGLAAALSEIGEGKVLLVDMHQPQGVAHPFLQGKPACEIADILEPSKPTAGMVHENLYVAQANEGANRSLGVVARQMSSLVPKLKASDYDYIIFDLPRVSAISPTLRLAAMMDLVLVVVEAEKVSRQAVGQACSLLKDAGAEAHVVLNKVRNYIPSRLSGEL